MSTAIGLTVGSHASKDLGKFIAVFEPLCVETETGDSLRVEAFGLADPNGNGLCSLAELEGFIQKMLMAAYPTKGKERVAANLFDAFRPCYIRAFTDAKDYKADTGAKIKGTKGATDDDFVSVEEFRLFNVYICVYAAMYDAFAKIGESQPHLSHLSGTNTVSISLNPLALSHLPKPLALLLARAAGIRRGRGRSRCERRQADRAERVDEGLQDRPELRVRGPGQCHLEGPRTSSLQLHGRQWGRHTFLASFFPSFLSSFLSSFLASLFPPFLASFRPSLLPFFRPSILPFVLPSVYGKNLRSFAFRGI